MFLLTQKSNTINLFER